MANSYRSKIGEKEYFLNTLLNPRETEILENLLNKDEAVFKERCIDNALVKHAKHFNKPIPNIKLRLAQITPVLMSAINPRIFIGDKPGLGKTVMSAESFAFYKMRMIKQGKEPKKCLVVTKSDHVQGFCNEWKSFGIDLLAVKDGSTKIEKTFEKEDVNNYDGVITNWDSLKTNGFLAHYLENADMYDYGVFDETSYLINDKSIIYGVCDNIINNYQGGMKHILFLNGSSFEKNIYDFYNQFKIFAPKLIPTKKFIEDRYVIRSGRNMFVSGWSTNSNITRQAMMQINTAKIENYTNQEELRERLKYYYIARSKEDYYADIPKHINKLHPVWLGKEQIKALRDSFHASVINSPKTLNKDAKFDMTTSPKLKLIVEFADETIEDRPVIYVFNKEAQKTIASEIRKFNHKVVILNGETKDKQAVIDAFNNEEYDVLITNVDSAVNIPSSDRLLFYDIPSNPQKTTQICGRIDRNNDTVVKFYDFFCYINSPEMNNIFVNGYFREKHANLFTGQESNQYKELLEQLSVVLSDTDTIERYKAMFDREEEKVKNLSKGNKEIEKLFESLIEI